MTFVVSELVDHGADVNARNKSSQSPLDIARRGAGRDKVLQGTVELLRSLGAR
jgi:hypothetical protein